LSRLTAERPSRLTAVAGAETRVGLLLVLPALAVLVVAVAYAAGRQQDAWAPVAFWAGHVLLIVSTAAGALDVRSSRNARVLSVAVLAAAQSALIWCYRPVSFRFVDEFQHLRTARDVLATQRLFTPNSFLDVSPGFPGLEEVTTALASAGHTSIFVAGSIVVAVAHVLLVATVFLLVERVAGDPRAAAAGALLYAAQPHSTFLNGLFLYSVLALPFFVLSLVAFQRRDPGRGVPYALVCIATCVVTHHVTALATVAALVLVGTVSTVTGRGRRAGVLHLAAAAAGLVALGAWVVAVSPDTIGYLERPARGVLEALTSLGRGHGSSNNAPPPAVPILNTAAIVLSTLVMTGLLVTQVLHVWRRRGSLPPWQVVYTFCGVAYFAVLGMRVAMPGSPELAARALTYAVVLAAVPVGVRVVRLAGARPRGSLTAVAVVLLVYLGGLAAGWPPHWERVPAPFRVAAFERGIDGQVLDAADWAEQTTPTGRIACDLMTCAAVGAVTRTDQESRVAPIYIGTDGDVARLEELLDLRALDLVFVDQRMLDAPPLTGSFFFGGNKDAPGFQPSPADLATFPSDRRLDRWYDGGSLRVYRRALRGSGSGG